MEVCNIFSSSLRTCCCSSSKRGKEYYRCCFSRDEKLQKSIDYLTNYILYNSAFSHTFSLNRHKVHLLCGVEYDDTPEEKFEGLNAFKRLDANMILLTCDSSHITY